MVRDLTEAEIALLVQSNIAEEDRYELPETDEHCD